jgi:hypothetical protein
MSGPMALAPPNRPFPESLARFIVLHPANRLSTGTGKGVRTPTYLPTPLPVSLNPPTSAMVSNVGDGESRDRVRPMTAANTGKLRNAIIIFGEHDF